jgi:hypothetical protein
MLSGEPLDASKLRLDRVADLIANPNHRVVRAIVKLCVSVSKLDVINLGADTR